MSDDEIVPFLMHGTRTGMVATVCDDGRPHVVPVWFVVDGGEIVFTTWHESVKAENLSREGRAAMAVDSPEPPYAFVKVEGPVTIVDDAEATRRIATQIGGRYMGPERADDFGERNGVPGEWTVRLRMERVTAFAEMAS